MFSCSFRLLMCTLIAYKLIFYANEPIIPSSNILVNVTNDGLIYNYLYRGWAYTS